MTSGLFVAELTIEQLLCEDFISLCQINRDLPAYADMKHLFSTFFILLLGALLHAQEHNFEFISNHIYLNAEVN